MTKSAQDWSQYLNKIQTKEEFRQLLWEGSFFEYMEMVKKNPAIARNAFQRMYDMVLTWGTESYTEYKKEITRYRFFDDPIDHGKDAVFGLDIQTMKLVNFFKSAAYGYGTEKRVLLLHGPVGSAKSTLARLLKKGIEVYSKTDAGAMYSFKWIDPTGKGEALFGGATEMMSPMHEDPLKLIPEEMRAGVIQLIPLKPHLCPTQLRCEAFGVVQRAGAANIMLQQLLQLCPKFWLLPRLQIGGLQI